MEAIVWTRDTATGKFERSGELSPGDCFIETLGKESGAWTDIYRARFPRNKAIELIEEGIEKGQVRHDGYRIVHAPAKPIGETQRAHLADLRARKSQTEAGDEEMAKKVKKEKKERKARKPKTEGAEHQGRTPALAQYLKGETLEIFAEFKGKEVSALVDADGRVHFDGEVYTSPSVAAAVACKRSSCNGWTFWKYRKDGEAVLIDVLRGNVKKPKQRKAA